MFSGGRQVVLFVCLLMGGRKSLGVHWRMTSGAYGWEGKLRCTAEEDK